MRVLPIEAARGYKSGGIRFSASPEAIRWKSAASQLSITFAGFVKNKGAREG